MKYLKPSVSIFIFLLPWLVIAQEVTTRPPNKWEKLLLEDLLPMLVLYILLTVPTWVASVLARSKSWWAGGIIGAMLGWFGGQVLSSWIISSWGILFLGTLGLIFDYIISEHYQFRLKVEQHPAWWAGGPIGGPFKRGWKDEHLQRFTD